MITREVEEVEAALWPFGTPHRRSHESHEQVQRLAELLHAARAAAAAPDSARQELAVAWEDGYNAAKADTLAREDGSCPPDPPNPFAALLSEQPGGGRPAKLESGRCEVCGYEVVRLGSTRWQHARSDLDTHQAVPR